MVEKLKKQIERARVALVDIKNQQQAESYDQKKAFKFPPFPTYQISEDIADVFRKVREEVLRERNIYTPASRVKQDTIQEDSAHFVSGELPMVETVEHSYVRDFENQISTFSIFDYPLDKIENEVDLKALKPEELNLLRTLLGELEFATENMASLGHSIAMLNKMKTAVESVAVGRINDGMTVLRTAKKSAPNNRSLAFMLSQIYYFKAANGASESLPEARGEAKKAALYAEDVSSEQLMHYRYSYVVHESNHDQEKALNLIREFYLLNPESLTEGHGLGVHDGLHLKAWILLSMMDASVLTNFEVESLLSITMTASTGVNFYLNVMRPQILPRLANKDDAVIAPLYLVEEMLAKSYQNYSDLVSVIQNNFDEKGDLLPESQYMWTLENKYMSLLVKAAPLPRFDDVYLYTSLDAKRHSAEAYPNRAMAAMGLANVNYWQVWSLAITAAEGRGGARTMPVKRLVPYAEVFRKFDRMLQTLQEFEKEIVPDEKWELIEKFMPDYEYSIFPHVAVGPEAFQVPSNPYYLNFYRQWVTSKPKGPLPSEIIRIYAENGNFIEPDEVIAAFQGIARVITDDVHGLKARAKEALKLCLKEQKGKGADRARDILRETHFNDYWWLYVIVLPLAALAFFVIFGSGGSASGVFLLLVIIAAAGGFGYLIYSLASKGEDEELDDDDLDEKSSEKSNESAGKEK